MFWTALVMTFVLVIPLMLLSLIRTKSPTRVLTYASIATTVFTLLNWWLIFAEVPVIGFTSVSIWHNFWLYFNELLILGLILCAAGLDWNADDLRDAFHTGASIVLSLIVFLLLLGVVVGTGGVFSQNRATSLANQVKVTIHHKPAKPGDPIEVPKTDEQHILMAPRQVANAAAKQALTGNLGTIYEIDPATGTLASQAGTLKWFYPLGINSWTTSNRVDGVVPGYVEVNAEDPTEHAVAKVDDLKSGSVLYRMKYYPGGYFGHDIRRLIWDTYPDQAITDITLEPDDSGKPYFTASLDKLTLNMQPTVPDKLLVIDAWTGDIKEHSLSDIPDWVDRVYSKETVEHMLNWWGEWADPANAEYGFWYENPSNRYKVDKDQDPELVYVKGGHPYWQAVMTSYNSDNTGSYLALVDARTGAADFYEVPGLSLEQKAKEAIFGFGGNTRKLVPTHLTIHNIYGRLTWVAPLLQEGANETDTGESPFKGFALVPVDSVNASNSVVFKVEGDVKADALAEYRDHLTNGTDNSGPTATSKTATIDGTVLRVSQPTVANNVTSYQFVLEEDPGHIYTATVDNKNRPELIFIEKGAHVRITYLDTGDTLRTVAAYDDLGLRIGQNGTPVPTPSVSGTPAPTTK